MTDQNIELFVKFTPLADTQVAHRWFEQHGLSVTPMKVGALLAGTQSKIEQAFSISLNEIAPTGTLALPLELRSHVESVTFFKPRSYHS
ncbi:MULTISPECIES: hypothetical protein [unclassified Mesorhizobium]|uniref:hypothetical protein n=1 Tax=unclassified Mesorhizobium TaxID=325217 RepID=UPI0003CF076C|nr:MULTISPECIES: hypothetical protein [unclassified Mesorhizobium]ESX31240.1 hypothetical protein X764_30590 [Mesorhizobium sp. LSHC440A00]WJI57235.1 hypothetical protein NLY33_00240 [Mesorhizobium sp. C432A]